MENGHGAVTVGSEMAGGVKNLVVEECRFYDTDGGLRIKDTQRTGKRCRFRSDYFPENRYGSGYDAVCDKLFLFL